MRADVLNLWTIYDKPADYPLGFAARRFEIQGGHAVATLDARYGPDLDSVRRQIPGDLYRIERSDGDDPCIVETWL